jgi:hypothetical protein
LTSSKPTSKNFIKSATTNASKIRKITLATLIVAVSLSVAIEIGYTTSLLLVQGYTSSADSYKETVCTGKVQELSQKGIIRDVGGFSGAVYECTHTKYAGSIYGNVTSRSS